MKFDPPLEQGTLLRRYQRFFADVQLASGEILTVHCPNTGSMKNCIVPSTPCWFSRSDNPRRKLPGTLELTSTPGGSIAGVNTGRPNHLVREALANGIIPQLTGYSRVRSEVRYGAENSRIDLLLQECDRRDCYVEIKNVTLEAEDGLLLFPDAVTSRGSKHLRELTSVSGRGDRAVLFFCVQHSNARRVGIAADIDPAYARQLRLAMAAGVEVICYGCRLSPAEVIIDRPLGFYFPD